MNGIFKRSLIALTCSSVLLLAACNDENDGGLYSSSSNYLSEKTYNLDKMAGAASVKVMTYNMPNVLGQTKKATAMVFVPNKPRPANGWKIVVWEHGTVGI